jgi:hypothetical protein
MIQLPFRLRRPIHLALLTLPLLLAWIGWTEVRTLDQTRAQICQDCAAKATRTGLRSSSSVAR